MDDTGDRVELEHPHVAAAFLLADAWVPALNRSWRFGWDVGYAEGVRDGRAEEATTWHRAFGVATAAWQQPTFDQLRRRRDPDPPAAIGEDTPS